MPKRDLLVLGTTCLFLTTCTTTEFQGEKTGPIWTDAGLIWTEAGSAWPEASVGQCVPGEDQDSDKIPDQVEGCNGVDTDGDRIPDYADSDSDGDDIRDVIEGINDSDGDKNPDYKDNDSDNDGVNDGDEDLNQDGKLGCCMITCGEKREGCINESNGCGKGQSCTNKKCTPIAHFLCSNGETNPKKEITFPGKGSDKDLPTFICHQPGETSSKGLKPMKFMANAKGQWKVAIEMSSTYGEFKIDGPGPKDAGACFDLKDQNQAVAGFVISMATPGGDVVQITNQIINKLNGLPGKASVSQVSSGTQKTSQDGYPTVVSTQLSIQMTGGKKPAHVRNAVVETILGKAVTQLPQPNFGPSVDLHTLRFSTLLRKDSRIIVMGAVGTTKMANDSKMLTGIHLDDLSNGTGLATHSDTDTLECDPFILIGTPVADIIWVVDESGSMGDNRAAVANNATDFFNRALKSGLDFRMAVTGVSQNQNGKFCSQANGGEDRFLKPSEKAIFEACIQDPPGSEPGIEYGLKAARDAVVNHLPRKANDPTKIRPNATLIVIHATDEPAQSTRIANLLSIGMWHSCTLNANQQTAINNHVQPDIELFSGNHPTWKMKAKTIVHFLGGVCNNTCNAQIGHDYAAVAKATKGIVADVCQSNLGNTLQVIIDTITGTASTAKLEYVPISASLAVAVGKTKLARSRSKGFDYSPTSNSLVFIGDSYKTGTEIVASYRRYKEQKSVIE